MRKLLQTPICYGEPTGYVVSAGEIERMRRILMESRRPYHPSELPAHLRAAVIGARMASEHASLDGLLGK